MAAVPRSVNVLTAVLSVGAATLAATMGITPDRVPQTVEMHLALAGIAVALTAAGAWQLEFRRGDDIEAVDLFEAALMPALLLFAGPIAVGLAVAAKIASQRFRGVDRTKAAFNVAQWGFATAVASMVLLSLREPGDTGAATIPALVLATISAMLISHLAVVVVLAAVNETSPRRVLADLDGVVTSTWIIGGTTNLALGLLFSALTAWAPAASVVALLPLALYDSAHRASEQTRADRRRLAHVQQATAALAGAVEPLEALPKVLQEARACFHGDRAVLVDLAAGDDPLLPLAQEVAENEHTGRLRGSCIRVTAHMDLLALRDCLAATVRREGQPVAVLLVTDPGGLDGTAEGEAAVLSSFASAIATAHQRHDATQATIAERRLLAQVFDTTSDGVLAIDAHNRIVTWNPAMERLTGFGATEMTGAEDLARLRMEDEHENLIEVDFASALADDPERAADLPSELRIHTRAGNIIWLGCSYAVASASGRQSPLMVVTVRDITEARNEAQLQHEFVAIASHELRTPATVVQGMAQTLMMAGDMMTPEQREKAITGVYRGAVRLHRVVTNVLAVARVEKGNKVALSDVDLGPIIEDSLAEVCGEAGMDPASVQVDDRIRDLRVHANDSAVAQVLVNLVGNALKYGDGQPVEITSHVDGDLAVIGVRDHGPGVPLHEQDRIFRRFERLHQHNMQAGTGLGLYISRQLAELCGGSLDLASTPGAGATFYLTLPLAEAVNHLDVDASGLVAQDFDTLATSASR